MVPARLGIVFNREHARLLPESAVADAFDDLTQGEIVVGDLGCGSRSARPRAARMIVWQADDRQIWKVSVLFEFLQLLDELTRSENIRNV